MTNPPFSLPSPAALWRALMDGCNLVCRTAPGYEAHMMLDSGQILTGEPHADMNFAYIGSPSDAARHLRVFHERASARGLPLMVLSTEATTPHLKAEAAFLGLVPADEVPLMICRPPRPDLANHPYRVEHIHNSTVLTEAIPLAARTFGLPTAAVARVYNSQALTLPGVDYFIARREGTIWSFVQTTRMGSYVGIWSMATPPEYQRQGAGRALLQAVLAHHQERGADFFYLIASSAGRALYQGVGFQETTRLTCWLSGTSAQVGGG